MRVCIIRKPLFHCVFYENETKCFINVSGFFFISNFISWLVPLSTYIVYETCITNSFSLAIKSFVNVSSTLGGYGIIKVDRIN